MNNQDFQYPFLKELTPEAIKERMETIEKELEKARATRDSSYDLVKTLEEEFYRLHNEVQRRETERKVAQMENIKPGMIICWGCGPNSVRGKVVTVGEIGGVKIAWISLVCKYLPWIMPGELVALNVKELEGWKIEN